MIHLSGVSNGSGWEDVNPVERAIDEIEIYQTSGLQGVIVENYHSGVDDVIETLIKIKRLKETGVINKELSIGVNILPNDFKQAFDLASQYGDFIQLDFVSGKYSRAQEIDEEEYKEYRQKYPNIQVLGGVWPKYYVPVKESSLEADLKVAMTRCDAIVVTGSGTGQETPLDKIKMFRDIIGNFPLIIGAGMTSDNAKSQLVYANGAIVGSAFKQFNNTNNQVSKDLVNKFMSNVI